MSGRFLAKCGMVLRNRETIVFRMAVADLALMLVVILVSLVRKDQTFGELELAGMIVGSLLAVSGSYVIRDARANWIRRLAACLWLAMAFLGPAISSEEFSGYYLLRYLLTGGLIWWSADVPESDTQTAVRRFGSPSPSPWRTFLIKTRRSWPVSSSWLAALSVGLLCGLLCLGFRLARYPGAGDFSWALRTAQSLLSGRDPYAFTPSAMQIPYPLPVALFGLPLVVMPPTIAAATFFGFSAALLTLGIVRAGHSWRLLLLLSFPFWYAAMFAQWSPLITAAWFFPILAPLLVLIKPQTALPIALNRLTWRGVLLALLVLAVSLAVYPKWPLRWIQMIGEYETIIPAMMLPLGPFLLLAALFPRDPRARLLLLMSVLPMRVEYDLLPLFLIPSTRRQMLILVGLSLWNPIMYFFTKTGYHWSQGVNSYHFYALCILLYSNRLVARSSCKDIKRAIKRIRRADLGSSYVPVTNLSLTNLQPRRQGRL